ncbi:hypothetical protein SD51_12125 [Alicyclobacillus tengchongensis]|nr:hypothetical protein SD51_12125 [Alicyclobacillus tengchongensis]
MTDGIKLGAQGRPHVECPSCGRLHSVFRRGDYVNKPMLRFRCRHCGTSWPATQAQKDAIVAYYQDYVARKQDKQPKRGRGGAPTHSSPLPSSPQKTGDASKPVHKNGGEKKSWLDSILDL